MRPVDGETHRVWRIGDWTLDEGCHRLFRGDEVRSLNPKEMGVLRHLVEAAPDVVGTDELFARTWADVVVGDHVLHEVISRLRKMLGDKAQRPRYIETLPRRGYRLLVPVELTDRAASGSASLAQNEASSASRLAKRRRSSALVLLALLMAVIVATALQHQQTDALRSGNAERQQPGIAVLPFVNLSGDPSKDFLGDAIASEVVHQLRPSDALRVISMTSSRAFRNTEFDIREIGARLTADYLLEGELTQSGRQLRATLRLIEASRGVDIWGKRYSVALNDLSDVFALYERIAIEAARAIESRLGNPASTSSTRRAIESDPTLRDPHATLGSLDAAIDLDFPAAIAR